MSGLDDILRSLPMDQLARQLGTDEATAAQAASMALPALLGGLQANAADPSGAASLQEAIAAHDDGLLDSGVDLDRVDTRDGEKISSHIFGSNEGQVVNALGSAGGAGLGGDLIKRLLPLLAPIVLSYLAKQMQSGGARRGDTGGGVSSPSLPTPTQSQGGGGSAGAPGSLQDMLGRVLGGGAGGSAAQTGRESGSGQSSGGSITDLLGGLLGGGRR